MAGNKLQELILDYQKEVCWMEFHQQNNNKYMANLTMNKVKAAERKVINEKKHQRLHKRDESNRGRGN